jgi:multidrug efflux pump subunit AcrA (membrane-fusion protein)
MHASKILKALILATLISAAGLLAISCRGSKANVTHDPSTPPEPVAVEVTTAPAILRDLPRFFEATGSLAGDQQTDVAPSVAGKVTAIGVDLGSYVKRGQMLVRLDDVDSKLRVEQARSRSRASK